jgi:hypothetical protein
MELEHLGANAQQAMTSGPSTTQPSGNSNQGSGQTSTSQTGGRVPHPAHPGRIYMLEDSKSGAFNTPSFVLFFHAHDKILQWLRKETKDPLTLDDQKLETMRDALFSQK